MEVSLHSLKDGFSLLFPFFNLILRNVVVLLLRVVSAYGFANRSSFWASLDLHNIRYGFENIAQNISFDYTVLEHIVFLVDFIYSVVSVEDERFEQPSWRDFRALFVFIRDHTHSIMELDYWH
ncbi:NADH-ubiquinone oxidoreductase chain 1, partial [Striga asiatica]